jgi:hypothetical protein
MGAYAYIFVAGFVIVGGLSSVAMRKDNRHSNDSLYEVHYKEEARDAAVTGMHLTVRKIVADEGQWTNAAKYQLASVDYRKASFSTTVTTYGVGDTVDVTSVGLKAFMDRTGSAVDTTHTIDVRIIRADLGAGVPPGFDVAILTDGDMLLNGTMEIRSLDPTQNADIHANGMLETRGNSYLVEGYGSYTGSSRIRNGDNFQPNYDKNEGSLDVVYQDSIYVPPIDVDGFRTDAIAEGVYNAGDVDIDQAYLNSLAGGTVTSFADLAPAGSDAGTTPDNPLVFFTEGAMKFTGDVTLDGYGSFVSVADLMVNANVEIKGAIGESFYGNPTTQMGIFTAGDAIINGGALIQGTVYIGGETMFNGTADIVGGAIMNQIATMLGTFTLTWVGPNEGLLTHFGGGRSVIGPIIAAWAEW